jgi:hypothetical protein
MCDAQENAAGSVEYPSQNYSLGADAPKIPDRRGGKDRRMDIRAGIEIRRLVVRG